MRFIGVDIVLNFSSAMVQKCSMCFFILAAVPTVTRVVAYSTTVVGIEWILPSVMGTINGYNIYVSGNEAPQDSISVNGSVNTYNVTNLLPSNNYTITITVTLDGEEGSMSVPVTVRTLDVTCDPPCPFGGECVGAPNTCNCSSITDTGE